MSDSECIVAYWWGVQALRLESSKKILGWALEFVCFFIFFKYAILETKKRPMTAQVENISDCLYIEFSNTNYIMPLSDIFQFVILH